MGPRPVLRSGKRAGTGSYFLSLAISILLTAPAWAGPRRDAASKEAPARGGASETALVDVAPGTLSGLRRALPAGIGASGLILEIEPNDTSATAQAVPSTTRVRGTLHRVPFVAGNPDADFYSFTASAGDRIFAATMTGASGSSSDTVLGILDVDGTTVIESDDEDGTISGNSSNIAGLVLPAAGTYFVRVTQFDDTSLVGSIRPYDLYVRIVSGAPVPEVEPNNNGGTPNPLPSNGYVSGVVAAAADNDTFSLAVNAGDTIVAILDVDPERDAPEWNARMGIAPFNDFILVANGSGVGGAFDDANPSEALMMTAQSPGNFFIYVDEPALAGAANFTYHLAVFVIPATPRTCTTYTGTGGAITDNAATDFTLNVPDANVIDYLKLRFSAGHTTNTAAADFDFTLLSPDGNEVFLADDLASPASNAPPQFNTTIEDEGGVPVGLFGIASGPIFMPELEGRMEYFRGMPAQGNWILRIRDDTLNVAGGTLNAWSLDVCTSPRPACIVPGPVETPVFTTDFETGDAGFTHAGFQDEWERGLPTFAPLTTAHSGTSAWKTDLDNTYNVAANMDLQSGPIDLTSVTGRITLSWWQKFQMESASFDNYWVEVRTVGVPASARRSFLWSGATMTRSVGNPATLVQQSAGWGQVQADISSFAGSMVEVRFHVDSDLSFNFAGVAVDDVSVTACSVISGQAIANLAITKSDGQNTYTPGELLTYTIVVTNGGPHPVTGANVEDAFPAALTGATWTCTASGGSSCANASGTGNIDELVNLLPSGTATFVVSATVAGGATGDLVNTATATVPTGWSDPDTANNTATDTDLFSASSATRYFTVSPCRLMDTRDLGAPIGGPALSGGVDRTITVPPSCGIPASALSVSLNITAVNPSANGNIRFWPTGSPFPNVSMLNFSASQTRGNNGIATLGPSGQLTIQLSSGTAHFVIDVNGYFE